MEIRPSDYQYDVSPDINIQQVLRRTRYRRRYTSDEVEIPTDLFEGNLAQSLRTLICTGTDIGEIPPSIGNLINLEYLDIRDTQITIIPKEILRCTKLSYMNASYTERNFYRTSRLNCLVGFHRCLLIQKLRRTVHCEDVDWKGFFVVFSGKWKIVFPPNRRCRKESRTTILECSEPEELFSIETIDFTNMSCRVSSGLSMPHLKTCSLGQNQLKYCLKIWFFQGFGSP